MDTCGVDVGVIAAGIAAAETDALLEDVAAHPDRLRVALTVDRPDRPVRQVTRLRELAAAPGRGTGADHAAGRPSTRSTTSSTTPCTPPAPSSACRSRSTSASPGLAVRSACQHPELLEDVLIDFKGLTVIGAHMGHPYESLLMQYMLKWPDLYLSNSAYLAKYMDPALVAFMDSSRGAGRVLFASDHPFLPMERAVAAARDLPLSEAAAEAFLGGTATRLLRSRLRPVESQAARTAEPRPRVRCTSVDTRAHRRVVERLVAGPRRTGPQRRPRHSRRSATGRCGRPGASNPGCRPTSSACSPRRIASPWPAASSASGPAHPRTSGRRSAELEERFPGRFLLGDRHQPRRGGARLHAAVFEDGRRTSMRSTPWRRRFPQRSACWPRWDPACSSSRRPAPPAPIPTSSRSSTRPAPATSSVGAPSSRPRSRSCSRRIPPAARELARGYARIYLELPNYTENLRTFGFGDDDIADGGSDRLIDAVIPWGDADHGGRSRPRPPRCRRRPRLRAGRRRPAGLPARRVPDPGRGVLRPLSRAAEPVTRSTRTACARRASSAARARNARPRWDTASFSSGRISAKVCPSPPSGTNSGS